MSGQHESQRWWNEAIASGFMSQMAETVSPGMRAMAAACDPGRGLRPPLVEGVAGALVISLRPMMAQVRGGTEVGTGLSSELRIGLLDVFNWSDGAGGFPDLSQGINSRFDAIEQEGMRVVKSS